MDIERQALWECLADELGEILTTEILCPGVYYLSVRDNSSMLPVEFYVVEAESDSVSPQAKAYGQPLPHHPELLTYLLGVTGSGSLIVQYEAQLYRVQHRMPLPEDESILGTAVYGREENPDYFGDFPAPLHTPFGEMVCYKRILSGVFALVTSTGTKAVSVCYPIWAGDLTDFTVSLGAQTQYDRCAGIHNTFGNLYFSEKTGCLALFELSLLYELSPETVDVEAVKNAVFQNYPEYVIHHNRREQAGLNDSTAMIQNLLGAGLLPAGREEHLLSVLPSAGTNYLKI